MLIALFHQGITRLTTSMKGFDLQWVREGSVGVIAIFSTKTVSESKKNQ